MSHYMRNLNGAYADTVCCSVSILAQYVELLTMPV